jgi:hyperosmotically inducible periplasmic protein
VKRVLVPIVFWDYLPASVLTVSAKSGAVAITGTVPTQAQFERIEGLAKEIKAVTMKVAVAPGKN